MAPTPAAFQRFAADFPTVCRAAPGSRVWARRRRSMARPARHGGLGCDASPVAITQARALADRCGMAAHCHFEVVDLDDGLPEGLPADMVICNRFRDARLDRPIVERLARGGLLAISARSEVGASPGPFRVKAGELRQAFDGLDIIAAQEANGEAWLLARRPHFAPHLLSLVRYGLEGGKMICSAAQGRSWLSQPPMPWPGPVRRG